MATLNRDERDNAIGRLQAGQRQGDVARAFNVSRSTISRLWSRFQATGTPTDRPRSGRPRATTAAQDRFIVLRHLRDRFTPASSTAQAIRNTRRISDQTVRNRLHTAGLRACRPVRGPVLTRRHREARLQWSRQHLHWTIAHHWRRVLFSDVSHFLLQRHERRRRVYRRRNERVG